MANDEHVAILKKGAKLWNEWRRQNEPIRSDGGIEKIRPDLTEADLNGAKLDKADLTLADLTLADLRGADLPFAHLYRANLTRWHGRSAQT